MRDAKRKNWWAAHVEWQGDGMPLVNEIIEKLEAFGIAVDVDSSDFDGDFYMISVPFLEDGRCGDHESSHYAVQGVQFTIDDGELFIEIETP